MEPMNLTIEKAKQRLAELEQEHAAQKKLVNYYRAFNLKSCESFAKSALYRTAKKLAILKMSIEQAEITTPV